MFKSLRKAAHSLSRDVQSTFSSPSPTQTAHINTILTFPNHIVRLGPVFAEGGFSYLHTATPHPCPPTPTRYAVKRLPYPSTDSDLRSQIDAEISLLSSIPPHPNVVTFHGSTTTSDTAFLLFDLIDGGTLPEFLKRSRDVPVPKLAAILSDIAAAIAHFHSQSPPISIRDVKLENILYDRCNSCFKLCDFGSASTFAGIHSTRQQILRAQDEIENSCTAMYRAPELVDLYSKKFICERVDVWALGCVWHALLYKSLPFDGFSALQITKGLQGIPPQPVHPKQFQLWLKAMLTVDPAQRCDIFHVLHSVLHWQGKHIDPVLNDAAQRLRALRQRDLGIVNPNALREMIPQPQPRWHLIGDDSVAISNARTSSLPTERSEGNENGIGDAGGNRKDGVQSGLEACAGGIERSEDGGWADFESAFGTVGRVDSPRVEGSMNTTETTAAVQHDPAVQGGSVRAGVDDDLLIDFGDMVLGGADAGRGTGMDSRTRGDSGTGGGADGRERDLIDFG